MRLHRIVLMLKIFALRYAARKSPPQYAKTARLGDPGLRRKEGFFSCFYGTTSLPSIPPSGSSRAKRSSRALTLVLSLDTESFGMGRIKYGVVNLRFALQEEIFLAAFA